jgi:hypothetical protein
MRTYERLGYWLLAMFIGASVPIALYEMGYLDAPGPDPMLAGMGSIIGPGLQGTGTSANPLDIKAGTSSGQAPLWNGSAWSISDSCGDPSTRYCYTEEFESSISGQSCSSGKFIGNAGAGASCTYTANTDGHPGVQAAQTGTTNTIGTRWSLGASTVVLGTGVGEACVRSLAMVQNLSTASTEYFFKIGFAEPITSAESVDTLEAVYDRPNTGDKWALKTCNNNTCATIVCDGTGGTLDEPVVALQWYELETCMDAGGTSATLKVNKQVCATQTDVTRLPVGATRATSVGAQCFNNGGAAAINQICYVDYMRWSLPFGVPR